MACLGLDFFPQTVAEALSCNPSCSGNTGPALELLVRPETHTLALPGERPLQGSQKSLCV